MVHMMQVYIKSLYQIFMFVIVARRQLLMYCLGGEVGCNSLTKPQCCVVRSTNISPFCFRILSLLFFWTIRCVWAYVCMSICTLVCICVWVSTFVHVHAFAVCVCVCACVVCVCARACEWVYTCVIVHAHVCGL